MNDEFLGAQPSWLWKKRRRDARWPHRLEACATINVNLFQLVIDLSRIASGQQDKQFKRSLLEFQFSLFCAAQNNFSCLFFPPGSCRIEPVENLNLRAFNQHLVKLASLIDFCGADQKRDSVANTAVDQRSQFFERSLHRV